MRFVLRANAHFEAKDMDHALSLLAQYMVSHPDYIPVPPGVRGEIPPLEFQGKIEIRPADPGEVLPRKGEF